MTPKEYARSLRLLAEWYENQPEGTPVPFSEIIIGLTWENEKEQVAQALALSKQLGESEKEYSLDYFYLKRIFGKIDLKFMFKRAALCTRRVVGVEHVPEHTTPAHDKEIVEWDCHPLLGAGKE